MNTPNSTLDNKLHAHLQGMQPFFADQLLGWYQHKKINHPWRQDFLTNQSPYPVLISEIMLQQTTIQVVTESYLRFVKKFPTLESLAAASEQEVLLYCQGLGYYSRFRRLHLLAKTLAQLSRNHDSIQWPKDYFEWLKMPGIGEYTAAAISSIAYDERQAVIDGNVIRVLCRLFDLREVPTGKQINLRLKEIASTLLSDTHPGDYNQGLMELGQRICRKSGPECRLCPVSQSCLAYKNNTQTLCPAPKQRTKTIELCLEVNAVVDDHGRVLFVDRDNESYPVLKTIVGFPYEIRSPIENLTRQNQGKFLGQFNHRITCYKILAQVFLQKNSGIKSHASEESENWIPVREIAEHLHSSFDMKVYKQLKSHICLL